MYFDGAVLHLIDFEFVSLAAKIAKTLLWNEINKPFFYINILIIKKTKNIFKYLL